MRKILLLLAAAVLSGCWAIDDAAWIDARHKNYYETRGFKVLGYQGYNMWATGRCYWYVTQRSNTIYESCLQNWRGEIHEYNLQAVDAIKGTS